MPCRFAAVVLFFAALSTPAAEPPADPRFDRKYDLTFATVNGENLQLDLVVPKTGGPQHPVVVCFHGGAWKFGSRKDLSEPQDWFEAGTSETCFLDLLAARGFAAASVSYRFAPKYKFPAQIADAKAAIRYLRTSARGLNLDPNRVAALGFSAGGHLAALVGTTSGRPEFDPTVYRNQSDKVCCVVNFFGPTDLTLYTETPGIAGAYLAPLLGAGPDKTEVYLKASPIEYVTKDTPPFLTIHGTADLIVPVIHAERLHQKLLAAGVRSVFLPVKGKGHGWSGEAATETTTATVRFLAENFGQGAK